MKIRKLLAAVLVLVMVLAAVPAASLAEGANVVLSESRRMSKLEATWAVIDAAEARALNAGEAREDVIRHVYKAALNNSLVDKDSFSDFTKDGFFFTVDGMNCSYNYRLRNELASGVCISSANEPGIQVFPGNGKVVDTRDAGSPNVLLVAPWYSSDSSFTDQYKNEAQSIANATGGTYTLIQNANATGPAIAAAYPNKGVIIYDSHGAQSGTTSYLCLTSSTGLTTTDYNNGWAINGGSWYGIDGRYIQNHISSSLANPFVWMAICEGMKKEGKGTTGTALLAAGCGGVYGYSQSVSFTGDYKYETVFWNNMKNGKTVKEAIAAMKSQYGVPDPVSGGDAYPIVMSPVDSFPSNPDSNQTVNCTWKLIGGTSSGPDALTSVSLANVNVYVGATAQAVLTVAPTSNTDYTVTYKSSNTSVATVNSSGVVTGVKAGTATLTATVVDNAASKTYTRTSTITVSEFEGWQKVTSVEVGAKYIIVETSSISGTTGYAVGNSVVANSHYLNAVGVTVNSDGTLTIPSSVSVNAITWVAGGSASAGYTWKNVGNSKYMGLDSSQYIYPSDTAVNWLYDSNYYFNNQVDSDGYYYLSYDSSNGRYTTSKNGTAVNIYKLFSSTSTEPDPVYYTVTFKDWDGTVLKTQTVEEGGAATAPANPSRTGYTFKGWDKSFSNVTSNLTVTATYTINTYTVTFKDWDGTVLKTQTVNYGSAATAPANPTREGYTFAGWDKSFSNITANLTVTATYTQNTTPDDPTPEEPTGTYYTPVTTIETGAEYLIGYSNGTNTYLLMNYNPNPLGSNNYYYNSSSNYYGYGIRAVMSGSNVVGLDTTTFTGATLEHVTWKFVANGSYYKIQSGYNSNYYLRVYSSTSYADLYAANGTSYATKWQYSSNKLSYYVSSSVTKYAQFVSASATDYGYFGAKTSGASNIILFKKTTGTVAPTTYYTVTFKDWDGTVLKTQQVEAGKAATAPADPTREGYTFAGWDKSFSNITADTVVTATYTQNTAVTTVTYQLATTVEVGAKYIIVAEGSISGTTGYAVGNTIVTSNHYLSTVAVTVNSNGTLTIGSGVDVNAITWVAGGSASAGYTWKNVGNSKYMGLDSSQYLYPSTTSVAWLYENGAFNNQVDSDGYYYLSYSASSSSSVQRYTTSKNAETIRLYKVVTTTANVMPVSMIPAITVAKATGLNKA